MLSKCTHNHEVAAMDMPWTTVLCWQLAWSFENKELRTEHYMIHCWTMLHRKRGWTNGMNDPSCWTESSHRTMKSTTGPQLDEKRWTNINVWCSHSHDGLLHRCSVKMKMLYKDTDHPPAAVYSHRDADAKDARVCAYLYIKEALCNHF